MARTSRGPKTWSGVADPGPAQARLSEPGPGRDHIGGGRIGVAVDLDQHRAWLGGVRMAFMRSAADLDDQVRDRRMQMEVLVGVDVVEGQAGRGEGFELRLDLARQLRRAPALKKMSAPRRAMSVRKLPSRHQVRDVCRVVVGRPSTSTRCRPTHSFGSGAPAPRRRPAAGAPPSGSRPSSTPSAWPRSDASLTARALRNRPP